MNIQDVVAKTKGKFFAVNFVKKDNTIRHMVCRTGVTKHLRGGNKTTGDKLITVYDVQAKGYRCFYPESVISLKCGDYVYGSEK